MKKRIVLFLVIIAGFLCLTFQPEAESKRLNLQNRQTANFSEIRPQNGTAASVGVSKKVGSFAPASPEGSISGKRTAEEKTRAVPNRLPFRKQKKDASPDAENNLANISAAPMPAPSLSFNGLSSSDNAAGFGFRIVPPDTFGDVGPNHYVQAVNALIRVYDKQGNPLTPPFKLNKLFEPLDTPCSRRNDGDPVVLYDALADRWLFSQFCTQFPPFRQMIAVSKTGDPTAEYYIYEFVMPNIKLNDYSKIGVWSDGFYMATDQFIGGDYAGTGVFAFDRAKMLKGEPDAGFIYFDLASPSTIRLGGLLPADFDGLNAPPAGAPNVFVGFTATEYGDAQDAIRLFDFRADFQNPNNSTFTERPESPLAVAAFDPTSPDGRADISQPAPGEKLDSQSDRLMFRAAYRNFGSHESLVFNQTARASQTGENYRAGVRVYHLSRNLPAAPFSPFTVSEAATVGGTDTNRWMASAAQDHQGNIAVGYSTGSEEKMPSIFYTGRAANEPVGTFRSETALVTGTGVQKAFGFRWGDYSAMSIDPADDCSFWMTNQYYTLESQNESDFGWLTRVGKFKFAECSPAPRASIIGAVKNSETSQAIPNAVITANAVYSRNTNAAGGYEKFLLLPGTYSLTAAAKGFRTRNATVTIADGQILTQDFALEPTAVFEDGDVNIKAESCTPNNAVDPSETVTADIGLSNLGAQNTTNLTATLLPGGGVTGPSQPQNYGVLANGVRVYRPFTFTASPNLSCGGRISLTLQLQDGEKDLGTITVNLLTGKPNLAFSENFDSGVNLPAGWTTSTNGGQKIWKIEDNRHQTPPNSVFSPAPHESGINELVSPVIQIKSADAELVFSNWYELETTFLQNKLYDGSVLEIKIGAGDWQDIEAAGGVFLTGGYDGVIDSCCQNPIAGRRAWSGGSGTGQTPEFIKSKVKLPSSAAGNNVQLRWRVGTDIGTFREGQYIDDVVVNDGYVCSCASSVSRSPFDFDGDSRTDISIFRPSDNPNEADFHIRNSSDNSLQQTAWGSSGDKAVNSDYDGDGKTDTAVFRPSSRTWFILRSSDFSIQIANFGLADDKLTPADFDGDGRADIAVFRPETTEQGKGFWYILQSSNNQFRARQFGISEDYPVAADFDGDGKADIAVFRPSVGIWYISRSSDNGFTAVRFGANGDKPVVGDYDGDGRADFAVFRPSDRNWYLLRSQAGFAAVNFGLSDDKPLQGDFDGDGRRDIAVFRPSNSSWYILKSSDNAFSGVQFGIGGDTAVSSIFIS